MSATAQYAIGTEVRCEDGDCGRLDRVVVDPVKSTLTHLVVQPPTGAKRLVPVELASERDDGIALSCDVEAFVSLETAEETEFLPGSGDQLGYRPDELFVWPFFAPNAGVLGMGAPVIVAPGYEDRPTTIHERVPAGEVQIRRGERVEASDGEIGRVHGLVVDERDHSVTHVLLSEGHLWGRKTVAIPMSEVTRVGEAVRVRLTKAQLNELPDAGVGEG
ncbi:MULTISPECIES: PRC-barrel domain-containing protein [unclassified Streptomyces]|uniref:PRC-barrel domain-containing protein n=1 Tax=unclassified Streptomyces TaxID=2593676 RepID=UPI002E2DB12F|nr:PRC-barrel domain-containing protein [Streptomyces sp. NBC_00223]